MHHARKIQQDVSNIEHVHYFKYTIFNGLSASLASKHTILLFLRLKKVSSQITHGLKSCASERMQLIKIMLWVLKTDLPLFAPIIL